MIKKNEMKKMWVWNFGGEPIKGYVTDISIHGKALVVDQEHEVEFREGKEYYPKWYDRCKRIEESEWRVFGAGEMPMEYLNYLYREKNINIIYRPIYYDPTNTSCFQLGFSSIHKRLNWVSNDELYDNWEVLKHFGGEWQPVGKERKDEIAF